MSDPLLDHVARCLRDFGSAPGVVAVSGGPDSVALLRLLANLQTHGRIGELTLVHLNHKLRGEESDADEVFVQSLANDLSANGGNILYRSKSANVAELARSEGENLESVARRLRYEWFAEVAREQGAGWVATGHTADDQAETVLHRLLRGTGMHGLAGIPARRQLAPGIAVIRPLLAIRRATLLAYLEQANQPYRSDASNVCLDFTRNRIRHELLPHLAAHYNPGVIDVLCRLAEQAAEVQEEAEQQAAALLTHAELPRAGPVLVFDLTRLKNAERNRLREMFRLVWKRENWPLRDMTFEHWDRLAGLVFDKTRAIDLPGGLRARTQGNVVQLALHD